MSTRQRWDYRYVCSDDGCTYSTRDVYVGRCPRCGGYLNSGAGRYEWVTHRVQWWRPSTWGGGRWVFTGDVR